MNNIPNINDVRKEAIDNILKTMDNDIPIVQDIYRKYLYDIKIGINYCIINNQLQFILKGGAPTGKLPGLIEALLLLQGYSIEKGVNENEYLISIFDVNNYRNF